MASLVKNGNNYGLIWTDSNRNPSQVRESLKTESRSKARDKKKKLEWEYHNGEHDPWKRKWYERQKQDSMQLSILIERYIRYKAKAKGHEGWNETTAYNSASILRKLYDHNGLPIAQLTEDDIEDFLYRDEVKSDHTRRSHMMKINAFLNWAVDEGYIKERPKYRTKKPQSKIPKFLYPEELKAIIDWKVNHIKTYIDRGDLTEDRAAFWVIYGWMILAGTGMRPSELAQTKLSHIQGDSIIIGEDYTDKVRRQRTVRLLFEAPSAVEVLAHPHVRSLDRYMKKSPYLLGRSPGRVTKQLSRNFRKAWDNCFPDRPSKALYNLKDTFAVRFLCDDSLPTRQGLKHYDLMQILGHSNLETTEKYLKAIPYGTSIEGTIWDVS